MKPWFIILLLTMSLAVGGCAGMSDTQQRTVSGGAIGAGAGAVIGAIAGDTAGGAALLEALQPHIFAVDGDALRRDVALQAELVEHHRAGGDDGDFVRRWREMPLRIFHDAKGLKRQWFALDGDRFRSRLDVADEHRQAFDAMTAELVERQLADARGRDHSRVFR